MEEDEEEDGKTHGRKKNDIMKSTLISFVALVCLCFVYLTEKESICILLFFFLLASNFCSHTPHYFVREKSFTIKTSLVFNCSLINSKWNCNIPNPRGRNKRKNARSCLLLDVGPS